MVLACLWHKYQQGQGGVSPRSGGRDAIPPNNNTGSADGVKQPKWVPHNSRNDNINGQQNNDAVFRRVRGILNKLTPDKFDKLGLELLNVGITSNVILKGIILLIFEKALDEPKYSFLYAQLCHRLSKDAPNFEPPNSKIDSTFRHLLLSKCQDEFENRSHATQEFDRHERGTLTTDEEEQLMLAKKKMLGNIKFIGELGKLQMLHEKILHTCIKQLLETKKHTRDAEMVEDMECLCQIMRTVGPRLDTKEAKVWMDAYFRRMHTFMLNEELSCRIRFMLKDVLELRENKWVPRRSMKEVKPRTIQEVRDEAAKDLGLWTPHHGAHGGRNGPSMADMNFFGSSMMNGRGGRGPMGMNDMFTGMTKGFMDSIDMSKNDGLGTGPGVIPMDGFAPGYSNNMGRPRTHINQGFQQWNGNQRGTGRGDRDESGASSKSNKNQQQSQYYNSKQPTSGGRELPPRFAKKLSQSGGGSQTSPNNSRSHSPMEGGRNTPPNNYSGLSNGTSSYTPAGLSASRSGSNGATTISNNGPSVNSTGASEISLRPGKTYNMFKPNTPSMLPKSAQVPQNSYGSQPPRPSMMNPDPEHNPLLQKQAQITIKQVSNDHKTAKNSKKSNNQSQQEFNNLRNVVFEEFVKSRDVNEAVVAIKNMKASKKNGMNLLVYLLQESLENEDLLDDMISLMSAMNNAALINTDTYIDAVSSLLDKLPKLDVDIDHAKGTFGSYLSHAILDSMCNLKDVASLCHDGAHYPLFFIVLEKLVTIKDKAYLTDIVNKSKIDLTTLMPKEQREKEHTLEILESRGVGFLMPILRMQIDLWKLICCDSEPDSIEKWITENVEPALITTTGFINVLVTNILRYVTSETTLGEGIDTTAMPDKALQEKEREILHKYKDLLHSFVSEKHNLQLQAIYALQVLCHTHNFPKGLLLRMFIAFYDMEVAEEEAFLKWKEELNEDYPGKGKALFQVNQWLTWLEQAEEESEEEEDDD